MSQPAAERPAAHLPTARDGAGNGKNSADPSVGIVSLGCPKALVDSERILTKLRSDGYSISGDYAGADVVIVNTCGFLDSAKAESLNAIGEAMAENGRVIVTGCMGVEAERIRAAHPGVLAISGPHQYESVVEAVYDAVPRVHNPHIDLVPPQGLKLTPRHYAYLKISEGCNHSCSFCIIPSMRGKLASRPSGAILREAEKLAAAGVKELLVISQDTSAYGLDLGYKASPWTPAIGPRAGEAQKVPARFRDLCDALGQLGIWVRLHYVYPYPHVDEVIPLMAEGKILPYLDIPFQHAHPEILRAMKRPGKQERVLERIRAWREVVPDIAIRSTFIVGFPGETEEHFSFLLDWLREARIDRLGCFKFEPVEGAAANDLPGHVPEEVKQERWQRLMAVQQEISAERLQAKVGRELDVLIDEIDDEGAIARSYADAPEIDGNVFIPEADGLATGMMVRVKITEASEYDLWAEPA
jgi:ribosomal protein S12 methylthiotransferase